MKSPLISIIIPAYTRWPYLKASLRSIKKQTLNNYEVIVVDDGSKLALKAKIHQFFPGALVIRHPKNRGPAAARNSGFKRAKGSFICWLDSDDQLEPEFVEVMTRAARQTSSPVLCLSTLVFAPTFPRHRQWLQVAINVARNTVLRWVEWSNEGRLIPEAFFAATLSRMVFPRRSIQQLAFKKEMKNCEDWDFLIRLMEKMPITIVPQSFVKFRFDAASFSHLGRRQTEGKAYYQVINLLSPSSQRHPLVLVFKLYTKALISLKM